MEKLVSKGLYSKQLNHLTTSKVLGISKIAGYIEIKYLKTTLSNILHLQLAPILAMI